MQAPDIRKARMYKVLKEVIEDSSSGKRTDSGETWTYVLSYLCIISWMEHIN